MDFRGKVTFYFLFAAMLALSACGNLGDGDQQNDSAFTSQDEMNGLFSLEISPIDGEDWTYGPKEQARGFYACADKQEAQGIFTCGTLVNADRMPLEGPGYRLAVPASRDVYATYDLITILTKTAEAMEAIYPGQEGLRVGELSKLKGGYSGGHDSHQNGLDADLGYFRVGMGPLAPAIEHMTFEAMVVRQKVQPMFDLERNYEFMKMIVRSGRANRIFVHPAIKRGLCEYAKGLGEPTDINPYLSVIRGYPFHGDHMHVRITCPRNSPKCKHQVLPSANAGCEVPAPRKKRKAPAAPTAAS